MKHKKGTLFDSKQYTRESINETERMINICGFIYNPGEVLEEYDNEAFIRVQENLEEQLLIGGIIEEDDHGDYVWAKDFVTR